METLFDSPDEYETRFVTVDGYETRYVEAGDPDDPPLVLVHGGACSTGLGYLRWFPNIVPLAENFHVFAVDELGSGRTDPPRDLTQLGHVRVRADHVLAFVETLDVGPVHLVGQSQGGWIATYVTLQRPDLVEKLVLIDSGSVSGSDAGNERNGRLPYAERIFRPGTRVPKADLTDPEAMGEFMGEFCYDESVIVDEFLDHHRPIAEDWWDLYLNHGLYSLEDPDEETLAARSEQYHVDGEHIIESVSEISRPTLVLWGRESNKGLDPGYRLYKRIPGAQFHVFDRANHFLWLDRAEAFNSLVAWYLEGP